uniref:[histone H3]-lysine(4) N-methyltransferase n=1 Tax=Astyanax mexicanus TaxID=7994 RepID=A0A8B9J803_ASTMX
MTKQVNTRRRGRSADKKADPIPQRLPETEAGEQKVEEKLRKSARKSQPAPGSDTVEAKTDEQKVKPTSCASKENAEVKKLVIRRRNRTESTQAQEAGDKNAEGRLAESLLEVSTIEETVPPSKKKKGKKKKRHRKDKVSENVRGNHSRLSEQPSGDSTDLQSIEKEFVGIPGLKLTRIRNPKARSRKKRPKFIWTLTLVKCKSKTINPPHANLSKAPESLSKETESPSKCADGVDVSTEPTLTSDAAEISDTQNTPQPPENKEPTVEVIPETQEHAVNSKKDEEGKTPRKSKEDVETCRSEAVDEVNPEEVTQTDVVDVAKNQFSKDSVQCPPLQVKVAASPRKHNHLKQPSPIQKDTAKPELKDLSTEAETELHSLAEVPENQVQTTVPPMPKVKPKLRQTTHKRNRRHKPWSVQKRKKTKTPTSNPKLQSKITAEPEIPLTEAQPQPEPELEPEPKPEELPTPREQPKPKKCSRQAGFSKSRRTVPRKTPQALPALEGHLSCEAPLAEATEPTITDSAALPQPHPLTETQTDDVKPEESKAPSTKAEAEILVLEPPATEEARPPRPVKKPFKVRKRRRSLIGQRFRPRNQKLPGKSIAKENRTGSDACSPTGASEPAGPKLVGILKTKYKMQQVPKSLPHSLESGRNEEKFLAQQAEKEPEVPITDEDGDKGAANERADLDSSDVQPGKTKFVKNIKHFIMPVVSARSSRVIKTPKRFMDDSDMSDLPRRQKKCHLLAVPPKGKKRESDERNDADSPQPLDEVDVLPEPPDGENRGGPRIKHVCRAAAVVLGQPRAIIPDDIPRLSALPLHERSGISPSPADKDIESHSDPDSPVLQRTPKFRKVNRGGVFGLRSRRCGECKGCLHEEDCGTCLYCLDKTKFGGPNTKRQCCRRHSSISAGHSSNEEGEGTEGAGRSSPTSASVGDSQSPSLRKQPRRHVKPRSYCDLLDYDSDLESVGMPQSTSPGRRRVPGPRNTGNTEDCGVHSVWSAGGMSILTSVPLMPQSVCLLCASRGQHEMLYCQVCCEPFHPFCLDPSERPQEENKENWCCRRCKFCRVCGRKNKPLKPLLECERCQNCYHPACLGPNYPKPNRRKRSWVCMTCIRCKSCGVTPGKSWDTEWDQDKGLCPDCTRLYEQGNYCTMCFKCYEDNDYESQMMQCSSCNHWVHAKCEGLTDDLYEILSSLPESVVYSCQPCIEAQPAGVQESESAGGWRELLMLELRAGVEKVLACLLSSTLTQHLVTCKEVSSQILQHCTVFCDVLHFLNVLNIFFVLLLLFSIILLWNLSRIKDESSQFISTSFLILSFLPLLRSSGMLLNAILPPTNEHVYAQWREHEEKRRSSKSDLDTGWSKDDERQCVLCQKYGDAKSDAGRLLYLGQNEWAHVNCSMWSAEVFEEDNGCLMHVHSAVARGRLMRCERCNQTGATVGCCLTSCQSNYHFMCARSRNCVFQDDKTVFCYKHRDLISGQIITGQGFEVLRRVYVDFEGISLRRKFLTGLEPESINMKIGSLLVSKLGKLNELSASQGKLVPVGYECSRWYWSAVNPHRRCKYTCRVMEVRPAVQEKPVEEFPNQGENRTIAHSPCPQSESGPIIADVTPANHSSELSFAKPELSTAKPKSSVYSQSRRPAGGLKRPLPSPGAAPSKSHHILTISDLDDTCRPRRHSSHPQNAGIRGHATCSPLGSPTGSVSLRAGGSHLSKSTQPTSPIFPLGATENLLTSSSARPVGRSASSARVSGISTPPSDNEDQFLPRGDQPHLRFKITSDDGFSVEADSIEVAWRAVLDGVQEARAAAKLRQLSFTGMNGARMMGLLHDAVVYLVEQLQGASSCHRHPFRFHKQASQEEDLPINPSGCARSEVYLRYVSTHQKSTFDMFNFLASQHRQLPDTDLYDEEEDDVLLKSSRRATSLELPMAMRFRHLERTSKEAVGVYRSAIHGRGLFCKRNIEAGEMVIEYSGIVIRSVLTDKREKYYDGKGIGCYMFRIDDFDVVDATMHGNAARFINHSCEPNCYSRVINVEGQKHIVIFALRKIYRGEELTYDYKFPIEDASNKLGCNCGARRCRRFLN